MRLGTGERIVAVDALRGLAIIGMVVFHVAWDVHDFGWSALDPSQSPAWVLFGQAVACCFLFLSGLGLVLAHRRNARVRAALRRIGLIGCAALGVTLVTAVATPGETVRFGILHCIALSNLLALPFLGAPLWLIGSAALTAAIVPLLAAGKAPAKLWWLGLSDQIPPTIDVRPLLPWVGVVLLGVLFGRWAGEDRLRDSVVGRMRSAVLATVGRHSLVIYLVHQPLLFGLFSLLAAAHLTPARSVLVDTAFTGQCQAACDKTTPADQCEVFCACARWHLERQPPNLSLTPDVVARTVDACRGRPPKPLDLHGF